jgi:hypothetical protein
VIDLLKGGHAFPRFRIACFELLIDSPIRANRLAPIKVVSIELEIAIIAAAVVLLT